MIVEGLIAGTLSIFGTAAAALELGYRQRLGNKLELSAGKWRIDEYEIDHYRIVGELEFINLTPRLDVMVPEIYASVTLLSSGSLQGITTESAIVPRHQNADPREDNYWESYIIEPQKPGAIEVPIDIWGRDLSQISAAWVQLHFYTYGRGGRIARTKHIVVPLKFPNVEDSKRWRPVQDADLLPIRTHLLTPLDNPVEIVKRYVLPHASQRDHAGLVGNATVLHVPYDFEFGHGLRVAGPDRSNWGWACLLRVPRQYSIQGTATRIVEVVACGWHVLPFSGLPGQLD
jgi:hypothetical protein